MPVAHRASEKIFGLCLAGGGILFIAIAIRALITGELRMTSKGGFKRRYERSQGSTFYHAVLLYAFAGGMLVFSGLCLTCK